MIDFRTLGERLLANVRENLAFWLPGGKLVGQEYECGSLRGEPGSSLRINVSTGKWSDFATGEKGGDLISLYAAIEGLTQGEAAKRLAEANGIADVTGVHKTNIADGVSKAHNTYQPQRFPPPGHDAPQVPERHPKHGEPSARYDYTDATGWPLFAVLRYDTDDGKQFCPITWDGTQFKMKAWPDQRPLFRWKVLADNPTKPVLLVEGEKAAVAANELIGDKYVVTTWSGGGNAWKKTDLTPLHGRNILIWPDNDDAGRKAAAGIAAHLFAHCPTIKVIQNNGSDGFDAADWTEGQEAFIAWAKSVVRVVKPTPNVPAVVEPPRHLEHDEPPWPEEPPPNVTVNVGNDAIEQANEPPPPKSAHVLFMKAGLKTGRNGRPPTNADTVERLLEVMGFKETIWFDEFHRKMFIKTDQGQAIEWTDAHDVKFMVMFQRDLGLSTISKSAVMDGILNFAMHNTRNEPRDWMESLTWDGTARVPSFFVDAMKTVDTDYTRAVAKNFWVSMVARVYRPGCKADEMVILEGKQGTLKSTALEVIGGAWYSKVGAELDSKDFQQSLFGVMLMEMDELDKFGKAAETTIKRILSTATDRLRVSYGRHTQNFPRTCIFVGSTNERNYLKDSTGGRRFWPLAVPGKVDLEYIRAHREQLFAEAVALFKQGANWHEVPEAAIEEQAARREVDIWEQEMEDYVTGREYVVVKEFLFEKLNMDLGDATPAVQYRIQRLLTAMGWRACLVSISGKKTRAWVRNDDLRGSFTVTPSPSVNPTGQTSFKNYALPENWTRKPEA